MAGTSISESDQEKHRERLEYRETTRADTYTGTKEDLIGARLARDGEFPGDPGRGSTMVTYNAEGHHTGRGKSRKRGSGHQIRRAPGKRFCVALFVTNEQRESRLEAIWRQHDLERGRASAAEETKNAAAALDGMVTAKQHAKECTDLFWTVFSGWMNVYCKEDFDETGYRFSEDDIEDFRSMATELFYEIKRASPLSDRAKRIERLGTARANEARLNGSLQAFLERLPTLPALVEEQSSVKSGACVKKSERGSRRRVATSRASLPGSRRGEL